MAPPFTLYAVDQIKTALPSWPLSPWSTRKRIRSGELKAIKRGRRYYVTPEWLHQFMVERVAPIKRSDRRGRRDPERTPSHGRGRLQLFAVHDGDDALNAPVLWWDGDDADPNRAVAVEHVLAVIEVKAALTRRTASDALRKLEELRPLVERVDPAGERYRKYAPAAFWCGTFFFELRSADARHKDVLVRLPPQRELPGYHTGIILTYADRDPLDSGKIEFVVGETSYSFGRSPRQGGMGDSVRWADNLYANAMLMWGPDTFNGYGFDVLALLSGTYNPGRASSMHGTEPRYYGGPPPATPIKTKITRTK